MGLIKRISVLLLVNVCCLSLFACGGGAKSPVTEVVGNWKLTYVERIITDDLEAEQSAVQYSGETVQSQISEKPAQGNVFVLVRLIIEKEQSGAAAFSWDQLTIQDADGNRYARMENDSFLESYGYTRQKMTDLTLGKNEGYICFELPDQAASGTITLCYEAEDDSCSIPIT